MKRYNFETLIKPEHKFADNAYVRGRIYGIAEILCDLNGGFETRETDDGEIEELKVLRGGFWTREENGTRIHILKMLCTADQYVEFMKYVREMYPGLCEFNYQNKQ